MPLIQVDRLSVTFQRRQGLLGPRRPGVRAVDDVSLSIEPGVHAVDDVSAASEPGVRAVDDVSLSIEPGETLGLVGESGSGKTTFGRAILRALEPTRGRVRYRIDGQEIDLLDLAPRELRRFRRHIQMVFQDPYASLNPRMTVRDIIAEPLIAGGLARGREVERRVAEAAARCRLEPEHLRRYPHAFSGGQRQRIGIARAIVSAPRFVVCDESVSALDVSIRADVLNLLLDLQRELGMTYLFIGHDLTVVAYVSQRVAVMYLGRIVEIAPTRALFARPRHPYAAALIRAIPQVAGRTRPAVLHGEVPDPAHPPRGCAFHTRCAYATERCRSERPALRGVGERHLVACHLAAELDLEGRTLAPVAMPATPG